MSTPVVMILDSGVGGLSVARHIRQQRPDAALVYVADNGGFPYGDKTPDALQHRVFKLVAKAVSLHKPNLIVVACNTASTALLSELRSAFSVPFVGVVPAIKPACKISHSKHIGVLATPNTVQGAYIHNLINSFAEGCKVFLHGSPILAQLAEKKLRGVPANMTMIAEDLVQLSTRDNSARIDSIVLACTHFPLLGEELRSAMPQITHWIDSGEAIARRVDFCLTQAGFTSPNQGPLSTEKSVNTLIFTGSPSEPYDQTRINYYLGSHIANHLTLE